MSKWTKDELLELGALPLGHPRIAWKPSEKQAEFLAAPEFEILYGGARGGGKTDALIIDALGVNQPGSTTDEPISAIDFPKYRALLIRPSFKELKDVIQRCLRYYPHFDPDVKWHSTNGEFIFSSGARVELAYLKHESDVYQFQGREFQYIGWEELTLHPTDEGYQFLMSSLRAPSDLPLECYVRATTNPGGPGHEWVKEHFRIPDEGTATNFWEEVELPVPGKLGETYVDHVSRRFIPAKLTDNPYLPQAAYMRAMAKLSEQKKRAFIHGRWDIVDLQGVILKEQMERIYDERRVTELPHKTELPVHTFWDIGLADHTAIWFMQKVGSWYHFIDFYQAKQKSLDHYAKVLQDRGYVYGKHYLPHDAGRRTIASSGLETIQDMVEKLGLIPTIVVPRANLIAESIELARQSLSACRFNAETCEEGIKALKNWSFKYDADKGVFMDKPLHNRWSHAADAFRTFAQGYYEPLSAVLPNKEDLSVWAGRRKVSMDNDMDWVV